MTANTRTEVHRIGYFDYLRVFATFAVMIIHLASQNWEGADVNALTWHIFNFYDSVTRWAVPIFIMISGALFLSREPGTRAIFTRYVPRLAAAYLFWGVVYALAEGLRQTDFLHRVIVGYHHMWFIPTIICLYISIPILKPITDSQKTTRYFLSLALVFAFLLPQLVQLARDFGGELTAKLSYSFSDLLTNTNFHLALGYTGYFIGGYYLYRAELSKKARTCIYLGGLLGFAATVLLDARLALRLQMPVDFYYGHFTLNVLLETLAVFVWFRYHAPQVKWLNRILSALSKYSFGAYLVHFLVMDLMDKWLALNTLSFHPALSVPILGVAVFAVSFAVSWVLNQIPVLKKYIV